MKKEKIFVSAYACEPGLGSEIGVGWHWVLEMSKYFELWVLTRKSNQKNIEEWMREHQTENIHFLYYDLPPKLRFWKKGMRGVRVYYYLWQKFTNKIVKQTMEENGIEIYHLLTYGNSLWPASNYGIKKFFVWGPTGGVDTIPAEFSKHYFLKSRMLEWVRRMVVKLLPLNVGFQKRVKHANLILCKSYNMYQAISNRYKEKAILFTDVAVEMRDFSNIEKVNKNEAKETKYLAAGKLDAWRAFDVLVEAFEIAYKENQNIRLEILGNGADKRRIEKLIRDKGLKDIITMTEEVPMDEYFEKLAGADVFVNSCLKEGAVTASFDSMALSKPLICVDTGGYTRYFSNDYAVVLQKNTREALVWDMSKALLKLTDKKQRMLLGEKAHQAGMKYQWEHKGKEIYTLLMNRYTENNVPKL